MISVIDASALIRLFVPDGPVPEGLDAFFRGVELGRNTAIAPELLVVEAASVIHKKRRAGELSEEESAELLRDILGMPIRVFPHRPVIPRAFEVAGEHGLTLYDAIYVALALERSAGLFSADKTLVKVASLLGL